MHGVEFHHMLRVYLSLSRRVIQEKKSVRHSKALSAKA